MRGWRAATRARRRAAPRCHPSVHPPPAPPRFRPRPRREPSRCRLCRRRRHGLQRRRYRCCLYRLWRSERRCRRPRARSRPFRPRAREGQPDPDRPEPARGRLCPSWRRLSGWTQPRGPRRRSRSDVTVECWQRKTVLRPPPDARLRVIRRRMISDDLSTLSNYIVRGRASRPVRRGGSVRRNNVR